MAIMAKLLISICKILIGKELSHMGYALLSFAYSLTFVKFSWLSALIPET